ncbi:MAG: spore coat protein CotH [Lachnospiraceae bacterium]|nr:spore coat protein CotH [Lachnospiraceae bacterium]
MSTHKHIDKICCGVLAMVLLLTIFFINAQKLGVVPVAAQVGYASGLFDDSKVHTIDLVMDDWDNFIDNCENEEYSPCAVVIDGEAYKNVGIRAKGNTSLSSVAAYGNDRYSFKLEFDCYESGKTYHGLDKISLNNIIQDNTYMKDYLVYRMMRDFGVAAPLCSYVYIRVNGEDWGLYLAVEGVEESFLMRNYGNDYGNLYKPDSMDMGGGRGNGGRFDPDDIKNFMEDEEAQFSPDQRKDSPEDTSRWEPDRDKEEIPGLPDDMREMPEFGDPESMPEFGGFEGVPEFGDPESMLEFGELKDQSEFHEPGGNPMGRDSKGNNPAGNDPKENNPRGNNPMENDSMGKGHMGSNDVALIYSDDDYESYQNIFDNAKTDISDGDKDRLITSLKKLSEKEDVESAVDVEAVLRYFVVHNFVCNFDSYTGTLMHNYYLYEDEGKLSMIPWDYNLAFGGFDSQKDAGDMVNYPIDTPVSGSNVEDRPMLAWIFADEEYTESYHQYFAEFIDDYFYSGYFEEMITQVQALIAPYVEKDPTKFCSYEEFEKGAAALKDFCLLRAESVRGQLTGEIPATAQEQAKDQDSLVDASGISLSDMGSMGFGMREGGRTVGSGREAAIIE